MYKIKQLLALNRAILHTQDLAAAWGIENSNTLYTTIRRYLEKGILYSIRKGLYATVPIEKLDPFMLGVAIIHSYTYVSCETVLAQAGAIAQEIVRYTFVARDSQTIDLAGYSYQFRKLADRYLFNTVGIEMRDNVMWATPERALADLWYFSPEYHIDTMRVLNKQTVKQIQKEVGYL